jgi:hypothetical protein
MRIQNNQSTQANRGWTRDGGRAADAPGGRGLPQGWGAQNDARGRAGVTLLQGRGPLTNLFMGRMKTERDVKQKLQGAEARVLPAGEKLGPHAKGVTFTPEQVARIRNAPDAKAAAKEVRAILQETAGKGARKTVNELLDTKIRSGRNKNKASNRIMDEMSTSIARSIRSSAAPAAADGGRATTQAAPVGPWSPDNAVREGGSPHKGSPACGDNAPPASNAPPYAPPPARHVEEPVTVDLSDFRDAARTAAELASPLVFDLEGRGLQIVRGERVPVDLDGDDDAEMVTNPDNGLGLLSFDARFVDEDGNDGMGRSLFGDTTDLTAYGVHSPRADRRWDDGFAALRALCEHLYLVHGDKQHLDAQDIAFLQDEVGLRMRVGGLHGEDRLLTDLGITRLQLGTAAGVELLEQAPKDRFGNRWMHQTGATFTIHGVERAYADLWFAVTQRTDAGKAKPTAAVAVPA